MRYWLIARAIPTPVRASRASEHTSNMLCTLTRLIGVMEIGTVCTLSTGKKNRTVDGIGNKSYNHER